MGLHPLERRHLRGEPVALLRQPRLQVLGQARLQGLETALGLATGLVLHRRQGAQELALLGLGVVLQHPVLGLGVLQEGPPHVGHDAPGARQPGPEGRVVEPPLLEGGPAEGLFQLNSGALLGAWHQGVF